jgi:hypothetical protein
MGGGSSDKYRVKVLVAKYICHYRKYAKDLELEGYLEMLLKPKKWPIHG